MSDYALQTFNDDYTRKQTLIGTVGPIGSYDVRDARNMDGK